MRKLTWLAAAATTATLLVTGTTAANAATQWQPFKTGPFVFAAGKLCPFELKGDILYDDQFTRVTETYPDGSPETEEFAGALGIRFTDTGNGKFADRDVSGFMRLHHKPDRTRVYELSGDSVAPVYPGNKIFPPGDYVTHGYFVYVIHPDNSREYTVQQGTKEDVCRTLS
jgi:hypothetical protein